jgi:hypothetical protein
MYLVVKARHSNKFWARHLVDTVAMWLKCNSTQPFRVNSRPVGSDLPSVQLASKTRSFLVDFGGLTRVRAIESSRLRVCCQAHNPLTGIGSSNPASAKMGVRTAMCGKITRQSRWNLKPAVGLWQYRTKPWKNEEGVETGWRASRYVTRDEGTVRLSAKAESDRITRRSSVQI